MIFKLADIRLARHGSEGRWFRQQRLQPVVGQLEAFPGCQSSDREKLQPAEVVLVMQYSGSGGTVVHTDARIVRSLDGLASHQG